MYVQTLRISNLRCFREAELALQYPGRETTGPRLPNVNLILGNNGTGKTSVLRAIALAALSAVIQSSGFVPYRLVRRTDSEKPDRAKVEVQVELSQQDVGPGAPVPAHPAPISSTIERIRDNERVTGTARSAGIWEALFDNTSPAFLIVGYGAGRRVESVRTHDESLRRRSRQLRYERVAGLFEDGVTLIPLGAWLPGFKRHNPGRYRQVVNLINRLLPDECRFTESDESGELVFEMHGAPVPFPALSDGYRAYIGWIADLLYHICMGAPSGRKLIDNRGIVLVDEIDLHLHPEWQRTVVPRLASTLKNMQFVLTTHSPIVAGTLESSNIFVVEPDESGASVVHQYRERIHGLSAEQILLSSYFDLQTTRAESMHDELSSLAQRARDGDQSAAVEYMRRLARGSIREEQQQRNAPRAISKRQTKPAIVTE